MEDGYNYEGYIQFLRDHSQRAPLSDVDSGILFSYGQAQQVSGLQAENERLREALEIAKQYISGVRGICNIGNAIDTLGEVEQALAKGGKDAKSL